YISDTLGIPSVVVSNTIGWSLGDLGPGENSSFEIGLQPMTCLGNSTSFTNAVRIAASTPDFDDNDNYDQAGPVTIPCGSDLVVVKNDGVGPGDPRLSVKAGDFITYSISINNVGSEIATNVVLTETLPANTVFVGPVDTDGWFLVGGSTYTYAIGNLNPNEGRVVKFIVQVAPDLPCSVTEVVNTVQAGSDNVDLDSTDNISNEDTPVECQPLLLSKHDGGLICAIPGQLIDYTITVTNNNIVSVNDLVLTEFPDPNTSFQGPLDQWPVAPPYVHSIETLDPGEPKPIPFWVQVDPAIPASVNAITNVVTLTPTNLVFTLTTPIVRDAPDLYVVKNDNIELIPRQTAETIARIEQKVGRALPWLETFKMQARSPKALSVSPGDVISYSVAYGNAGTFTATNVVITETLPDNTQFLGPAYWTQINANTYIFTITNLIPNQGGILDFRVRVDDPFPDNTIGVTNTVRISSDYLLECDPSDNISVEFTPVQSLTGTFIYLPLILRNYPVLTETPTPAPNPPSPTATPLPLAWVSDVVADPTTNQVFIASPREDAVHVIDGASDTYNRAVPVGHGPSGLAVLTSTTPSKILVVHEPDWTPGLWFINTNSLTSHSMVDQDGYVGARPVKVTANSLTNRAYVSNYWDRMPLINTLSESRIAWVHKKNFQASQGIKVSQPTNLVYMTSIDTGELIIFDAVQSEGDPDNYGACHNAPPDDDNNGDADPRNLRMVAVNPTTGHVFVTSPPDQNTGQTDSRVYVLDEATLLAEAQANGGPPSDLTCTWNFLPNGQRSPTALPGRGWIATIPLSGASPAGAGHVGIAVNPLTGKVYITDGEANKLFIIQDGKTASLSLPIQIIDTGFDNPQGVDVNFVTNKVYVANARDVNAPYGSVTVVDGASNTVLDIIPLDGSP
ncbi:MAG: DUF11 domain-containing protein, partial [Gammaproteobacteria bacterium]|nr:DUF11 domain-containing protein [Gammaproteobacteria bacterium]